ncbi:MAG: sigma 54-interacting transcriptional regulator [Acidobacteriota bacterium]
MLERNVTAQRAQDDIVGNSPAFVNVLNQVRIIAKSDSVTLIQGETGTGTLHVTVRVSEIRTIGNVIQFAESSDSLPPVSAERKDPRHTRTQHEQIAAARVANALGHSCAVGDL